MMFISKTKTAIFHLAALLLFLTVFSNLAAQDNPNLQEPPQESDDFSMDLFDDPIAESEVESESTDPFSSGDLFDDDLFSDAPLFEEPDIFSESDDSAPEENIFQIMMDNISGETSMYYNGFFQLLEVEENASPEPDNKRNLFDSHTEVGSYIADDIWRLKWKFATDFGNQADSYVPAIDNIEEMSWMDWFQDIHRERLYINVQEVYLSLFFNDFDIVLGKKSYPNTLSSIYSPADNYSPTDQISPFDSHDLGKFMLELNYYPGLSQISAVVFPVYQGGKSVSALSRWAYYLAKEKQDEEGIDAESTETEDDGERHYTDISLENISYLIKFKTTLPGIDLFATGFYGLADNTVALVTIDENDEESKEYEVVPVIQGTMGFSSTIEQWEIHGEGLYNYSIESRDDDYLVYVAGFRYKFNKLVSATFLNDLELIGEYAGEWLIKRQSHPDYDDSTEESRGLKNDVLVAIRAELTDEISLDLGGQYEITDKGAIMYGSLEYTGIENFSLSLGSQFFYGPEGSDFYYWRDNSNIFINIIYTF